MIELGWTKSVTKAPGFPGVLLDGGMGLEGDADAGKRVEAVEEGWIECEAKVGEWLKQERVVRIGRGQHSCGCGGGFAEGSGAVEYGDADAAVVKFEGEGEADDACASDADVRIRRGGAVHGISLVGRRSYRLGLSVFDGDA